MKSNKACPCRSCPSGSSGLDQKGSEAGGSMLELDCTTLLSGPVRGNSLRWSDDDVLAVCLENGIALLPSSLVGPRTICDLPERRDMKIRAQLQPNNWTRKLCQHSFVPRVYSRDGVGRLFSLTETSSHDWSPVGLSDGGGCLLAVTARDNQVRNFHGFPV